VCGPSIRLNTIVALTHAVLCCAVMSPMHRFDAPHSFGSDTCVLSGITRVCGPSIWLNTIVALTHAGAQPPAARGGAMTWEVFSSDRMQQLQHSIR
jgi:hypothetical protein